MNTVTVTDTDLEIQPEGLDKLWSFRRRLTIPLEHVRGATHDPGAIREGKGLRAPGLAIGDKFAGTFHRDGERHFWNVRGGGDVVVIELDDEHYDRVYLSVTDPRAVVDAINAALAR